MINLDKIDWEDIIISAIENPQSQTANFEELKKEIHLLSTGFHKLQVITQTKKEKREEDKKFIDEIKKRQKTQ